MKLVATKQGKADKYDSLRCVRRDGTESACPMPRQGILPHDLVHYVVETGLGWRHGFLGQVAAGRDINFAAEYAHSPGNRDVDDQLIQAEALVESLQAQLWSGTFDREMFMEGLRGACAVRGRGVPDLAGIDLEQVLYRRAVELGARWQQVPFHGSLEVEMEHL